MIIKRCDVCGEDIRHIGYYECTSMTSMGEVYEKDIHICDICVGKLYDLVQDEKEKNNDKRRS